MLRLWKTRRWRWLRIEENVMTSPEAKSGAFFILGGVFNEWNESLNYSGHADENNFDNSFRIGINGDDKGDTFVWILNQIIFELVLLQIVVDAWRWEALCRVNNCYNSRTRLIKYVCESFALGRVDIYSHMRKSSWEIFQVAKKQTKTGYTAQNKK